MNIHAEKLDNGVWLVSAIIDNYRIKRLYYWFTKREAIRLFKDEIKPA